MTIMHLPNFNENGLPRPKVSIIMPAYNRAEFLRNSATMMLNQTFEDLELIISDDHSTDHTPQVARELMKRDKRVHYHRPSEKGGVTTVLNEAIWHSRGHYIQICHDHDIYLPTLTEKLVGVLDRNPSVVFAQSGSQGCDNFGNPDAKHYFVCGYPEVTDGQIWRRFMLRRLACPVTALSMIRRTALEKVGLFDHEFGVCTDVEMWLRLCAVGDVGYVNELLLYMRQREPGHPYAGVNWEIIDQVIRAHRKHLRLCYSGTEYVYWKLRREIGIDLSLAVDYLNSFRHRRWSDVRRGRAYLRRNGVFLSKILGKII